MPTTSAVGCYLSRFPHPPKTTPSLWKLKLLYRRASKNKALIDGLHVLLLDSRRRYAALKQAVADVVAGWMLISKLRVPLMSRTLAADLTPREIIFRSVINNKITGPVLANRHFVGHMGRILSQSFTFGKQSGNEFAAGRNVDIARESNSSDFIPESSLQ